MCLLNSCSCRLRNTGRPCRATMRGSLPCMPCMYEATLGPFIHLKSAANEALHLTLRSTKVHT